MNQFLAARFHRIGDPIDVLQVDEIPAGRLAANEVRIRVDAFALNRADWLYCRGQHYSIPALPSRIGSECAGTVVEIGSWVDKSLLGRRVCTVPFNTPTYGVQGEFATVPSNYIVPWPDTLSAAQAAATWMQYLTAYFALIQIAAIGTADHVLIPAASSSAGLAAIQLAKLRGATVIATTRTEAKADEIKAAGADVVFALDAEEKLSCRINKFTGNKGVRVVFDPVAGPFMSEYIDALAENARIFIYGLLSGGETKLDIIPLVRRAAIIHPYSLFNHVTNSDDLRTAVQFTVDAIEGGLRPLIDSEFDFADLKQAYHRLDSHSQIGKIIVHMGGSE